MNRRASPRFPTSIDATVRFSDGVTQSCMIRDLCVAGMYLVYHGEPALASMVRGSAVQVELADPRPGEGGAMVVAARVMRVEAHGLGLAIVQQDREVMARLAAWATEQRHGAQRLARGDQAQGQLDELILMCRRKSDEQLVLLFNAFLGAAREDLFEAANRTGDNEQEADYFAAINLLSRLGEQVKGRYRKRLAAQFELLTTADFRNRLAEPPADDDEGLDGWLAVRSLASKLEQSLGKALESLEGRLQGISLTVIDASNNPVGPFVLAAIFREELATLPISDGARLVLFGTMGREMGGRLKRLYEELNDSLTAAGVEPLAPRRQAPARLDQRLRYAPLDGEEGSDAALAIATGRWQGLRQLLRLYWTEGAPIDDGPAPQVENGALLAALEQLDLARLHGELGCEEGLAYAAEVLGALGLDGTVPGGESEREALGCIAALFAEIRRDPLLSPQARSWYEQLELPLLKAALLDSEMLKGKGHPALQLLDQLEGIAGQLPATEGALATAPQQVIDRQLAQLGEQVAREPQVFAGALAQLKALRPGLLSQYRENIAALQAQCEREQRVNLARSRVQQALYLRLGQSEVPVLVIRLLEGGWQKLLLTTLLKEGEQGVLFKTYLDIIEQLAARLSGREAQHSRPMSEYSLREWIARTLAIISRDEATSRALQVEIAGYLDGHARQPLATRRLAETALVRVGEAGLSAPPEGVTLPRWQERLDEAAGLALGTTFCHHCAAGTAELLELVWQDVKGGRHAFAASDGTKALELSTAELAGALEQQRLVRQQRVPLTRRACERLVSPLYQRLAWPARHDPLSGLLNRRAFLAGLEHACAESLASGSTHLLAYLDLDHFSHINTRCGQADGDLLLERVARLIGETLPQQEVLAARLERDRFAVLLQRCSRTRGLMLVNRLHQRLRMLHFACKENQFRISASIGVCEINADCATPSTLLGIVEEAMRVAKQKGRDTIQIHSLQPSRGEARAAQPEWVGRLDALLERPDNPLSCQAIVSLSSVGHALPGYEVWLDVQDELGRRVGLEAMRLAAERRVRSIDYDEWLLDRVLGWLEQSRHRNRLDGLGYLSLSLTGRALGNHPLIERFTRRLREGGLPAHKLCLGFAESAVVANFDEAMRGMAQLKASGCLLALDSVGQSEEIEAQLRVLPVDFVRLDGALIGEVAHDAEVCTQVTSLNAVARLLGKQAVAVAVDDEPACTLLRSIGVDFLQGKALGASFPLATLVASDEAGGQAVGYGQHG